MLKHLIALVPFAHRGQSYVPGQRLDVTAIEAVALVYRRKAQFASKVPPPPPAPEPDSPKRRRTYRRRDLQPEP